ncbi:protein FAR1-RELATED SEQUENCE 5-like [Telopea speciosissima]|uniref:protein FAR1-RELATED SEQUENCE 5-like n=1 Tax=Telopea speciosissima TaxID=54955 RepID=UPI001CC520C3|nr:protein FAR1-RELATED SEQUENCE 5-like [Telopea speciosissima]
MSNPVLSPVDNSVEDVSIQDRPRIGMTFESENAAYEFYNQYGRKVGFSIRRDHAHRSKQDPTIIKHGHRKKDKRDMFTKEPRAESRTDCLARLCISRLKDDQYECKNFFDDHNHDLHTPATVYLMRSQRQVSNIVAHGIDLANDSSIKPKATFDLMGMQITNIFWADPRMLIDYALFGDVVIFDTTFCTNKEYRPFGVFAGFNHHRGVTIALLYDETVPSFKWLFETFLEAHGQKKPKTIFTDQDAAIARAIGEDLNKCIFQYENEEEFENAWNILLDDYQLENNSCTQLSESINSDLKDYLRPTLNLVWFFKQFERIIEDKHANELKADFEARNTLPRTMGCNAPMLRQAGRVYTPYIFNEFRKEHDMFLACSVKYRTLNDVFHQYFIGMVDEEGDFMEGEHAVLYKIHEQALECNCRKFETYGILCCHVLKVLDVLEIKCIPEKYILRRWILAAKDILVEDSKGKEGMEDVQLSRDEHIYV